MLRRRIKSTHVSTKDSASGRSTVLPSRVPPGHGPGQLAFLALLAARLASACLNLIHDCDEVYNYWEPLHHLLYAKGLQTWEYSAEFALRSYWYLDLHAAVVLPLLNWAGTEKGGCGTGHDAARDVVPSDAQQCPSDQATGSVEDAGQALLPCFSARRCKTSLSATHITYVLPKPMSPSRSSTYLMSAGKLVVFFWLRIVFALASFASEAYLIRWEHGCLWRIDRAILLPLRWPPAPVSLQAALHACARDGKVLPPPHPPRRSIERRVSPALARISLSLLTASSACFIASTAFLPSTFTGLALTIAVAAALERRVSLTVAVSVAGA